MAEAMGNEFEFRIVTSDRDMLDTQPYKNIAPNTWNQVGKAFVYYVSKNNNNLTHLCKIIRETTYDSLYLNSLFDVTYSLLPLLASRFIHTKEKPIIIAPRGELSPGALKLKYWKKKPYLAITRALNIYQNIFWHASTNDEAQFIIEQFSSMCQTIVAKNLPATSAKTLPLTTRTSNFNEPLKIVFLSRISKKKNLDFALRTLLECQIKVQFDVWGTIEDTVYWAECEKLIESLPNCVNVYYKGIADHANVHNILSKYDLFFLPTHGENYGHVIVEALSSGTPVLLSNHTPWRNLEQAGVGWDLPLNNTKAFLDAIIATKNKTSSGSYSWRKHVFDYAQQHLNDPTLLDSNRQVFLKAIEDYCKTSSMHSRSEK